MGGLRARLISRLAFRLRHQVPERREQNGWGLAASSGLLKAMPKPNTQKSTCTMPRRGGPMRASWAATSTAMLMVTNQMSMEKRTPTEMRAPAMKRKGA